MLSTGARGVALHRCMQLAYLLHNLQPRRRRKKKKKKSEGLHGDKRNADHSLWIDPPYLY